jgi:hypothetical protein
MKTDMHTMSNRSRTINLSNVSINEAHNRSKGCDTVKVRIQGKLENTLRGATKKIVKGTVLNIASIVNEKSREIIERLDTKSKFTQTYSEEQIEKMALILPSNKDNLTIKYVQEYFNMIDISWRVAQKIIDKERELFPNRRAK